MASRKLGYRPDLPDARDLPLRFAKQGAAPLPAAFTMRRHVQQVFNQQSTSSCVAHAFVQAISVAEHFKGVVLPPPSRLFVYYNARRQHDTLVTDSGTYLRSAAAGLAKLGAPPEVEWPFATSMFTVNRRPAFNSYMRAYGRRGGAYYRIDDAGQDRVAAVQRALVEGMPVAFGTNVTRAFLDDAGNPIITRPQAGEPIAGGHAMCIVGYVTTVSGDVLFDVVNSWGGTWRDSGFFRMHQDYLMWSATSDLWCVSGWEAVRDVA